MIKLPITEKAQEYCEDAKSKSDLWKHLIESEEWWQTHFAIDIEDAFRAGANYVINEVESPQTHEPNIIALRNYLACLGELKDVMNGMPKNRIFINDRTMTENQKMRLELYREFKEEAQKAYDFIMGGEKREVSNPAPVAVASGNTVPNGLYLVYEDGGYKPYTGDNDKSDAKGVKYIGIVHDGHSFCVALKDLGKYALVQDTDKCPSEHPSYRRRECDALLDWECVERMKHIQEIGTDIPLADGECIPALPMVVLMCHYADKGLNEALKFVGGEPFDMEEYYWSVAEGYSSLAWYVYFSNGNVYYYSTKYYGYVVRPVAAFNI